MNGGNLVKMSVVDAQNHISDEYALQSYVIEYVGKYLKSIISGWLVGMKFWKGVLEEKLLLCHGEGLKVALQPQKQEI